MKLSTNSFMDIKKNSILMTLKHSYLQLNQTFFAHVKIATQADIASYAK